ncbi:kinase-like domain-containing protein [Pelagophyceae sp. CCMP2097]|nr:kinase-like domain-containing protein [Pelagophyceae sp. CCMP2097]
MGGGASVPAEMKQKIHTAFQIDAKDGWGQAKDLLTETQLRDEARSVVRLRQLALHCVNAKHDNRAVVDKIDLDKYKPKNVPKTEAVTRLLTAAMQDNILFKRCRKTELTELLGNFECVRIDGAGVKVVSQGDKGDTFYIIECGECDVYIEGNSKPVATLQAGKSFGELALMYNTPRAASVVSRGRATLWKIDREEYRLVLAVAARQRSAYHAQLLQNVSLCVGGFGGVPKKEKLLKDAITAEQLARLADAMDEDQVEDGKHIIREGDVGHTFYIIAKGEVVVRTHKDGVVATLCAGGYFGDRALKADDKRAATCTAKGSVLLLCVDRDDFITLLGSIEDLVENGTNVEVAVESTIRASEGIGLRDLLMKRTLGQGAFGRVKLVAHATTGAAYALKSQSKQAIVENSLQEHVLMERDILMQLDSPFIIKLVSSFQDSKYIYFLLELLIGGELFSHLRKKGRFTENMMKFYAASVVLGFEHMHAKKVAYRDLKPENLVLDRAGYVKIVDLGLAKVVTSKTWTLCGTPDYLAPEIILNEGHDKAVDYWALGVLMYELVAGVPPFYADDPMEVYEKILSGSMSFPNHLGKYVSDIVRKLLKLCQSKRLGNGKGGCAAIKKHRCFSGFAWDDLANFNAKAVPPPIDIKVSNEFDASHFDTYDEEAAADEPGASDWTPTLDD